MPKPPAPLRGIVVADFSRILAGPLCTMYLGDAGARVIKVEEPRGDETRRWGPPFVGGESAYFLSLNRNKESITLNLKSPAGRAVARRLVERADVVVENFKPGQKKTFGLDAASIRRANPKAIHCSIVGFDRDGAEAGLPGYDLLAQAAGGLMSITGERDGQPTKVGVALSDVLTAHFAFGAICAALYARERSGRGESIEISIFGATVASLVNVAQNFLVTGREPQRFGNEHPSIVPYQTFRASDRLFALAVATDRHFEILCRTILREPELAQDVRFSTNADRVQNRSILIPHLEKMFVQRKADAWVRECRKHGIPAARVAAFGEIFSDPTLTRDVVHPSAGGFALVQHPVRFRGERLGITSPPPRLGEHTGEVLRWIGVKTREIRELKRQGALDSESE